MHATEIISTYLKSDLRYKFSILDINHPQSGHSYIYFSNMWDRWLLFEANRGCKQTTFGKQRTTLRTRSYFWNWGKSRKQYCTAVSFRPIQTHGILNTTKSAKQRKYRDFRDHCRSKAQQWQSYQDRFKRETFEYEAGIYSLRHRSARSGSKVVDFNHYCLLFQGVNSVACRLVGSYR